MTDKDIKISVVVPVYNGEKYLSQCLDSLILQTYKNIEIICINDGSTDNTSVILNDFAQRDKRIKIINQENKGLSGARNTGIKYITGDYVHFVDADDFVSLCLYEKIVNILKKEKRNIDIFLFNALLAYEYEPFEIRNIIVNFSYEDWIEPRGTYFKTIRKHKSPMCGTMAVWTKIYKTNFILDNNIRFPDGLIYEDRLFSAETFLATDDIYIIYDYLYFYRQQAGSLTSTLNENIFDVFEIARRVKQVYEKYDFFEQSKYSYFCYILDDVYCMYTRCREDLCERFFTEGKRMALDAYSMLDTKEIKEIKNAERFKDLTTLSFIEFDKKYNPRKKVECVKIF